MAGAFLRLCNLPGPPTDHRPVLISLVCTLLVAISNNYNIVLNFTKRNATRGKKAQWGGVTLG